MIVGIGVLLCVGIITGIKIVLGNPEEKGQWKQKLFKLAIGAFVILGAFTIWQVVLTMVAQIEDQVYDGSSNTTTNNRTSVARYVSDFVSSVSRGMYSGSSGKDRFREDCANYILSRFTDDELTEFDTSGEPHGSTDIETVMIRYNAQIEDGWRSLESATNERMQEVIAGRRREFQGIEKIAFPGTVGPGEHAIVRHVGQRDVVDTFEAADFQTFDAHEKLREHSSRLFVCWIYPSAPSTIFPASSRICFKCSSLRSDSA